MGACVGKMPQDGDNNHSIPLTNMHPSNIYHVTSHEYSSDDSFLKDFKYKEIWMHKNLKKMLICGYIEEHYHHNHSHNQALPMDIINLTLSFYDDIFYWSFSNSNFNKFLSTKNGETIWSKQISINNVIFQYSTCPDGWFPFQKGYVQFYLEMIQLPSYYESINVNFKVYCHELNTEWSDTNTFNRTPQAIGWPRYHMRLSECKKFNSLHFSCLLDISNVSNNNTFLGINNKDVLEDEPSISSFVDYHLQTYS